MVRTFSPMEQFFGERSGSVPTPLAYFGSSLKRWYSFWDTATLYQDSGVTPVSADGQSIGQINDKSGNNKPLIQATAGNKPLYKTGIINGLSVGRFDGTDDWIGAAGGVWAATNAVLIVAICKSAAYAAGTNTIFGARSNATPANTVMTLERSASGTFQCTSYDGVSANTSDTQTGSDTGWHTLVGGCSSANMVCAVDGIGTATGLITPTPNTGGLTITAGARANSAVDIWGGDLLDCFAVAVSFQIDINAPILSYIQSWGAYLRGGL